MKSSKSLQNKCQEREKNKKGKKESCGYSVKMSQKIN